MSRLRPEGELTSAQVADYLGVKVQTVYAYVSRGVLTPLRRDPSAGSLFALADVQALAGGARSGRRRRPAASDDVRTAITEIGPGRLAYRGRDVTDLAGHASAEEVRALLTGDLVPGMPSRESFDPLRDALAPLLAALPDATGPLDRMKHAVLVAGATDVGRQDRRPEAFARAGARAATAMALAVPGAAAGGPGTLAELLAIPLAPCPPTLIDAALVLLADHDLAVSTTAVRVAVSSGADPYSALLAGLAAADSPQHMTASLRAVDWLRGATEAPQAALDAALAGDRPPGFGHVVYTEQDPRAQVLIALLEEQATGDALRALRHIEAELLERRGWLVNIDAALALLVMAYDLPRWAGAVIFACARTSGWTAHAIEELAEPGMRFRLRGVYSGARG
ncbi:citrate synthase [Ornithinimicrobium tianjinense]|uniref:citrate synthase (unknown stereospecificity) n=1 Tax=Ornithinimicrobium tianjinense TaxID=1195761 RepID=A0A917F4Q3_9MICO|nr:citrate synthase [Ornithinimicrobium tianjinense]GGF52361.1 citrate synthase [Ornithinimicrobium tianjinense]